MRSERLEPQGGVVFSTIFSVISPTKRRPIFDQKWPHLHSHWTPENQDMKWSRNLASRIVRGDRLGWLLPSQVVFWVMKIHKNDGTRHWETYVFTYYAHLFWGGERETSLIFSQIIGRSVDSQVMLWNMRCSNLPSWCAWGALPWSALV